jgi:hypothetical protein
MGEALGTVQSSEPQMVMHWEPAKALRMEQRQEPSHFTQTQHSGTAVSHPKQRFM